METILDLARGVRWLLNLFSEARLFGVPIDWVFHLVGAAVFVYLIARLLGARRAVRITVLLLVAKELFDVFAKTRAEYIRPPTLDLLVDFAAGGAGIFLGWWLARRRERRSA